MKKFISKTGIVLALLFSFLFSLVGGSSPVSAVNESETVKETVEVAETIRDNNTIIFTLSERLAVESIIYQFTYTADNGVKYAELVTDGKVTKIGDYKYSFNVSNSVIGVKIWKVKYAITSDYFKDKVTTGNNYVGDYNTYYKKNYIEVISDKLDHIDSCVDNVGFFTDICQKTYVFYFNLDTEIDEIVNLSLEYSIKEHKKTWWGLNESNSVNSYEVKLDHNQKVLDMENPELEIYLRSEEFFEKLNGLNDVATEEEVINYIYGDYLRPVLGKNQKNNGYDWYVQPLLDLQLVDKEYALWSGEQEQVLQEVAIIKMSYITHGEYYENVPVLDEDTGWVKFKSEETNKVKEFFEILCELIKEYWYVSIPVMLVIIVFLPEIIKGIVLGVVWLTRNIVIGVLKLIKFIITIPFEIFKGEKKEKEKAVDKQVRKNGYNRNSNYYKR